MNKTHMWETIIWQEEDMEFIHIIPEDDICEHDCWEDCWCNPKLEIVNGVEIYTHNSLDMREYYE